MSETNIVSPVIGMSDSQLLVLMLETFIADNYEIRRNTICDQFEYRKLPVADSSQPWLALNDLAFNTMVLEARRAGIEGNIRQVMGELVFSSSVQEFNPVVNYLNSLPDWDGIDREEALFKAIPGITAEQVYFACRWFRSCVAHWYGMDYLYGNQTVLTLIGPQGCGKSTFAQRLLPHELRNLFLDHLNLSNKNDKEMALTHNMLVNIDELDQVTPSQQAALKQLLTKSRVNGRKIYGRNQQMRERLASFVATTNNPHPLKDPTGSRRYLCIRIPAGMTINNAMDIDYQQLMAQALHEVKDDKMTYWFNDDEVRRIQQLNAQFFASYDLEQMISSLISKPAIDGPKEFLTSAQIINILAREYPSITYNRATQTRLGVILSGMGIEHKHTDRGNVYGLTLKRTA